LSEFNGDHIKGLQGRQILVHEKFIPYLDEINGYAKNSNIVLIVNHSYRFDKQLLSKSVVSPAKFSNHFSGFAIDFNIKHNGRKYFSNDLKQNNIKNLPIEIRNFLNAIRKHKELRWGGDFNNSDPVHIDYPINIKNKKDWLQYNKLCQIDFYNGIPKWKFWE